MSLKNLIVKKINHKNIRIHLKNQNIKKIYNSFKKTLNKSCSNERIAAAISGGPDSLALAFFLKCYSLENKLNVKFVHVNHNLRKFSNNEAKLLKSKLKDFGIKIEIINWLGTKPKKNIQSIARKKRYNLILKNIAKSKIKNLLIGHTEEDLIENFFIRLFRGSGLQGFVSFTNKTVKFGKFQIIRPLINIKKKELIFITNKVFGFYISDPSNLEDKYTRVKIRKIINELLKENLSMSKIILSLKNLNHSNQAVNYYVNQNISLNSSYQVSKKLFILKKIFFDQPDEIILRSLNIILRKINKNYYPPRGKKVMNLINIIKEEKNRKFTISSCIIEKLQNSYIIYGEKQKKN